MAFVLDHDEMAAGPGLMDPPSSVEWAADVETSMDEPSRNAHQLVSPIDDLARFKPRNRAANSASPVVQTRA